MLNYFLLLFAIIRNASKQIEQPYLLYLLRPVYLLIHVPLLYFKIPNNSILSFLALLSYFCKKNDGRSFCPEFTLFVHIFVQFMVCWSVGRIPAENLIDTFSALPLANPFQRTQTSYVVCLYQFLCMKIYLYSYPFNQLC